jgi:hypothetical protein
VTVSLKIYGVEISSDSFAPNAPEKSNICSESLFSRALGVAKTALVVALLVNHILWRCQNLFRKILPFDKTDSSI